MPRPACTARVAFDTKTGAPRQFKQPRHTAVCRTLRRAHGHLQIAFQRPDAAVLRIHGKSAGGDAFCCSHFSRHFLAYAENLIDGYLNLRIA